MGMKSLTGRTKKIELDPSANCATSFKSGSLCTYVHYKKNLQVRNIFFTGLTLFGLEKELTHVAPTLRLRKIALLVHKSSAVKIPSLYKLADYWSFRFLNGQLVLS